MNAGVQGGGGSGGGVVVTASNLVFQTVNDGRLRVDASSGASLWEVQTGASAVSDRRLPIRWTARSRISLLA